MYLATRRGHILSYSGPFGLKLHRNHVQRIVSNFFLPFGKSGLSSPSSLLPSHLLSRVRSCAGLAPLPAEWCWEGAWAPGAVGRAAWPPRDQPPRWGFGVGDCPAKAFFFGQICPFLVNFGRKLRIFVFSCIILLNYCSQLPKTSPKKSQNDRKKHPKIG